MFRACPFLEACDDFAVYAKKGHRYRVVAGEMGQQVQNLQHQTRVNLLRVVLLLRLGGLQPRNFDHIMPRLVVKPFRIEMQE